MAQQQQSGKLGEIVTKAWSDEAFKQRLLADTTGTLKAEGVDIPEGFQIKAVENSDRVYHLVLPAKPQMSDTDRLTAMRDGDAGSRFCVCSLLLDWSGLVQ
jgi:hypothetical protein